MAKPLPPETDAGRPANDAVSPVLPLMKRTDFPYVITLLFAFLSWAIAHAVDRATTVPFVKYRLTVESRSECPGCEPSKQPGVHCVTFLFQNVTRSVKFQDTTIRIRGGYDDRFSEPHTRVIGTSREGKAKLLHAKDGVELVLEEFHPGQRLLVRTTTTGEAKPKLHLMSSGVPTVLQRSGLRTWLVDGEMYIITSLIALLCCFLIVWARRQ